MLRDGCCAVVCCGRPWPAVVHLVLGALQLATTCYCFSSVRGGYLAAVVAVLLFEG